ncbi:MAG: hypothetical protein EOP48_13650 [Sphingobacteriales bacterium]|nr:MAG: hypothetical protein EOP48_13650 [Sphingobacteriales bacterium]
METESNQNDFPTNEGGLQPEEGTELLAQNLSNAKHKHAHHASDYVPHHSSHGRSNHRTFGSNHEPGTVI